jgi:hypothetical protein
MSGDSEAERENAHEHAVHAPNAPRGIDAGVRSQPRRGQLSAGILHRVGVRSSAGDGGGTPGVPNGGLLLAPDVPPYQYFWEGPAGDTARKKF